MGLTETIQTVIIDALKGSRITSASPGHINHVIDVGFTGAPDLDIEIEKLVKENSTFVDFAKSKDKIEQFEKGNVGKIMAMSTAELGVVQSLARNPGGFVFGTLLRKFAKGAGAVALAIVLFETVKVIIDELTKPGRFLDVRFRERIDKQIIIFLDRREQQELRQGFKSIITTTVGGLRGGSLAGNIGGNFYNPDRIPRTFIDIRRPRGDNSFAQDPRRKSVIGGFFIPPSPGLVAE